MRKTVAAVRRRVRSLLLLTPAIATAMDLGPAEIGLMLTLYGLGGGLAYLAAMSRITPRDLRRMLGWVGLGRLAGKAAE